MKTTGGMTMYNGHTEEVAVTQWCPFARVIDSFRNGGVNRGDEKVDKACRCLASGCGIWRWLGWVDVNTVVPPNTTESWTPPPPRS